MTGDREQVTPDVFLSSFSFLSVLVLVLLSPKTSRDLVSPVCGIFLSRHDDVCNLVFGIEVLRKTEMSNQGIS